MLAVLTVDRKARSMVGLSNEFLSDSSSMVLCGCDVERPLCQRGQAGTVQAWHKLGVGKICLGSGGGGTGSKTNFRRESKSAGILALVPS